MTSDPLENLARAGQLKPELPAEAEPSGQFLSDQRRLAHALALTALRLQRFRSENRYLVFQCLKHPADLPNAQWRVLDQAHRKRNLAEYEGHLEVDESLVAAMIRVARDVEVSVRLRLEG